jgi:hypothetical protein
MNYYHKEYLGVNYEIRVNIGLSWRDAPFYTVLPG